MPSRRSLKSQLNKYRNKLERMYEDIATLKQDAMELSEKEEGHIDLDSESTEMLTGLQDKLEEVENPLQETIEHLGGEV